MWKISITIACSFCLLSLGCATWQEPGLSSLERRASIAYAAGRTNEAEKLYEELTQRQPTRSDSWFRLGNLYAESGRLEAAEQAYYTALQQSADPRILHNLGLVQMRMGIEALREARRQLPTTDPIGQETRQYLETLLQEIP